MSIKTISSFRFYHDQFFLAQTPTAKVMKKGAEGIKLNDLQYSVRIFKLVNSSHTHRNAKNHSHESFFKCFQMIISVNGTIIHLNRDSKRNQF